MTKLFKNMVTASEALIVYEALQIAKAGGIDYKAALDLMQKTSLRIFWSVGKRDTIFPVGK